MSFQSPHPVRELHSLPVLEGFSQIAVTPGINLPLGCKKASCLKQQVYAEKNGQPCPLAVFTVSIVLGFTNLLAVSGHPSSLQATETAPARQVSASATYAPSFDILSYRIQAQLPYNWKKRPPYPHNVLSSLQFLCMVTFIAVLMWPHAAHGTQVGHACKSRQCEQHPETGA